MRKNLLFMCLIFLFATSVSAQSGIVVRNIFVNVESGGISYMVTFADTSTRYLSNPNWANEFVWFLSYRGRRVSDYFSSVATSNQRFTVRAVAWPGEVPRGHERYVTAQLGRERTANRPRDRRDDD